jgi:lysozyme
MTEQELRQKVVDTASEWLGTVEGSLAHRDLLAIYNSQNPLPRCTKMQDSWPWCAAFVSAVSVQCGLTDIMPTEMSCPLMIQKYQNLGRWVEDDAYIPSIGDVIFYDWDDSGSGDCTGTADHVGIVSAVGDRLTIIEGNCDDKVMERRITVNARYIRGYGIPDFAAKCGAVTETAEQPKQTESTGKTATDLAYEVINGDWGNGSARQEALTAAGYDYDEVQAEVNRLLSATTDNVTENTTTEPSEDEITALAYQVINGDFGNGSARVEALGDRYDAVQAQVNEILGG